MGCSRDLREPAWAEEQGRGAWADLSLPARDRDGRSQSRGGSGPGAGPHVAAVRAKLAVLRRSAQDAGTLRRGADEVSARARKAAGEHRSVSRDDRMLLPDEEAG